MAEERNRLFILTGRAESLEYAGKEWYKPHVAFYRTDRDRPVLPYTQLIADYERADEHDRSAYEGAVDRLLTGSEVRALSEYLRGVFPRMAFTYVQEPVPVAKARLQSMVIRHRKNERIELTDPTGDGPGFAAGMRIDFDWSRDSHTSPEEARAQPELFEPALMLYRMGWEAHDPCAYCGVPTDPHADLQILTQHAFEPVCDFCADLWAPELVRLRDLYTQALWDAHKAVSRWDQAKPGQGIPWYPAVFDNLARLSGRDYGALKIVPATDAPEPRF